MNRCSRREFVKGAGAATAAWCALPMLGAAESLQGPFRIAVINDEISPDFDHACYVASHDFGMSWIELRSMWGKNVIDLDAAQINEAQKILSKYRLKVTDIASPLFKTDWPGAPRSPYGSKEDLHGAPEVTFKQQEQILERSHLAWRSSSTPTRFAASISGDSKMSRLTVKQSTTSCASAAETCGKQDILLVLENEFACNTATGREAARTMNAVQTPHLALNWDPGNAVMRNELDAFPVAWELIPKDRIHHCHCKNAIKGAGGKIEWSPVDKGYIDWAGAVSRTQANGLSRRSES